jgi:hypothetical protein
MRLATVYINIVRMNSLGEVLALGARMGATAMTAINTILILMKSPPNANRLLIRMWAVSKH